MGKKKPESPRPAIRHDPTDRRAFVTGQELTARSSGITGSPGFLEDGLQSEVVALYLKSALVTHRRPGQSPGRPDGTRDPVR
jgi:hypothetical protein